ncbi:MAG: hypothetical protein IKF99_03190 [Oscillospiraceae bacterium]|nr:hypothetical protein [Oscillospiraceae bacterium]
MIQLYQTLDLRPIGIPQTLRLSQYDSDFEIIFELTNFDGTWILDTGTTAEVQGTKTDGHGYSADAVFDDQLKTVTIAGDVQMTAAAGRNVFEVVLFHDGDRLGSKNFILDVERAALDAETTQSDSQIKNFTEMVESAEEAAETATAAAEAAEEAAATFEPFTDEAKRALLACFENVAWINGHGREYYDALEDALYPETGLVRIEAVFEQGSLVVHPDTPLNDLKAYLTVTGYYSDGTTRREAHYTLSGTLTVGTSTVTVLCEDKTTTFTVTVTEYPVIRVFRGKGTSGAEIIDNAKRMLTEPIPYTNTAPILMQVSNINELGFRVAMKNIATNGKIGSSVTYWSSCFSWDDSTNRYADNTNSGWCMVDDVQTCLFSNRDVTPEQPISYDENGEPIPNNCVDTTGYFRLLFANHEAITNDLPEAEYSGYLTITGTKYKLEEADPNEFI